MREPDGFSEFVATSSPGLVRSATLLTGDVGLAEDLVQTALVKAWQRWDRIEPGPSGVAYVRRIVLSTFLSWRRRRWYGEIPTERLPERSTGDPTTAADTQRAVLAALRGLPPRQRAVLVLRFFDDLSEQETAEVLGCSVGTVKSQASKAKAALRTSSTLSSLFHEEVGHDPRR